MEIIIISVIAIIISVIFMTKYFIRVGLYSDPAQSDFNKLYISIGAYIISTLILFLLIK